jgi:hypothetical protein
MSTVDVVSESHLNNNNNNNKHLLPYTHPNRGGGRNNGTACQGRCKALYVGKLGCWSHENPMAYT